MQASLRVPEKEAEYPDPDMFGPMPAHGFFVRHVRGIEMGGRQDYCRSSRDERPALVLEDVGECRLHSRRRRRSPPECPCSRCATCEHFRLRGSARLPDTKS